MDKKALFIVFHGFDPNNGISKKITYQINALNACGIHTHLCYMEEKGNKTRMVDGQIIADYGSGLKSKILKRTEFSSIVKYAIKEHITFVYIRSNHNANPFTINMVKKMKKAGMKVVMEIPTYPYDAEYLSQGMGKQIFQDRLFRHILAKQLDAIITFSDVNEIFGKKTIRISNGIDFDSIKIKKSNTTDSSVINLIGVAEIHPWHGFDRVIKGLAAYYAAPHDTIVKFHIVGYFFFANDELMFKQIIADHHLEEYIILHGKKHGEELDKIFDECDFGIGSLGRHRVGIDKIKTLKNREYAARGIPFIYSETDEDFDDKKYVLKAPADETPIDINRIIDFYQHLTLSPADIRTSIKHLSWENQMQKVINYILFAHNTD
ncbi:glycosyltransferase family 1 protein [Prevotella sp. MA2016]|uniref:glycosyltransferase family 1 protein n=1 Tax=Prevotella sp. MA2016 TaxID=1408310 RepID=UPI00048C1AFB|nr:glycosyltransferase family 1 protein [Prevotella sp. MA2016]